MKDPWEIGHKWGEPYNCLDLLPLPSFSAWHRERKPQVWQTPWVEEKELRVQVYQSSWSSRWEIPEKRVAQREELPSSAEGPLCIQPSNDQHMYMRQLPKAGEKNYSKGLEGTEQVLAHKGRGRVPVPTTQMEKLRNHRKLSTQKGLAWAIGHT